jgi:hypothetical protein
MKLSYKYIEVILLPASPSCASRTRLKKAVKKAVLEAVRVRRTKRILHNFCQCRTSLRALLLFSQGLHKASIDHGGTKTIQHWIEVEVHTGTKGEDKR